MMPKYICTLLLVLFIVSCTSIKDLNYSIEGTVVNLSRKGLSKIPDEVFENKKVKVLRLYDNQIDTISERIGELQPWKNCSLGRINLRICQTLFRV